DYFRISDLRPLEFLAGHFHVFFQWKNDIEAGLLLRAGKLQLVEHCEPLAPFPEGDERVRHVESSDVKLVRAFMCIRKKERSRRLLFSRSFGCSGSGHGQPANRPRAPCKGSAPEKVEAQSATYRLFDKAT